MMIAFAITSSINPRIVASTTFRWHEWLVMSIGFLGVHEEAVAQGEARGPRARDSCRPRLEGGAGDSDRERGGQCGFESNRILARNSAVGDSGRERGSGCPGARGLRPEAEGLLTNWGTPRPEGSRLQL